MKSLLCSIYSTTVHDSVLGTSHGNPFFTCEPECHVIARVFFLFIFCLFLMTVDQCVEIF